MFEALDVDAGGAQYLPFAQHLLRGLKFALTSMGLTHGRKHFITPDGSGYIYVRTRRGPPNPNESPLNKAPFSPESSIDEWYDYIRIEAGGGGYICSTSEIPSTHNPFAISFIKPGGLVKIAPFLGYSYPPSVMPQFLDGGVTRFATGALRDPDSAHGYFRSQRFVPFIESGSSVQIGAFLHKYTEDGEDKTRVIAVKTNNPTEILIDTETDTPLTTGGAVFTDLEGLTFEASADGRTLVMEVKLTPGDPFDLSKPPLRNIRKVEVDFAGSPQAVFSDLREAGPFGAASTVEDPPGTFTTTVSATYQAVTGVDEEGAIVHITIDSDIVYTVVGGSQTAANHQITVNLPDGISETFIQTNSNASGSFHSAGFMIIYADPAVPILVYETRTTLGSGTSPGLTESYSRKIGVLVGNEHHVLSEESSSGSYVDRPPAKPGFRPPSLLNAGADDVTRNHGYFKHLRMVTFYQDSTNSLLRYFGGLTYGRMHVLPGEVPTKGQDPAAVYYIAAKDPENWIVGVFRRYDLDDNEVHRFGIWGGNVESAVLTQAYLDYLIAAEQTEVIPNEAFIAAMEAQDFTTFVPSMGGDSDRLPMV